MAIHPFALFQIARALAHAAILIQRHPGPHFGDPLIRAGNLLRRHKAIHVKLSHPAGIEAAGGEVEELQLTQFRIPDDQGFPFISPRLNSQINTPQHCNLSNTLVSID